MPPLSPPDPPLTDGVVTLRLQRPEDADALVAALGDPDIVGWTSVPDGYAHADCEDWMARSAVGREAGTDLSLLIADAGDDTRILGSVGLHSLGGDRPDIGYWVARDARGRGIAARAARLLGEWAVRELGLPRVEILVHPDNGPSLRAAQRAGFIRTGEYRRCPRDQEGDPLVVLAWPEDESAGGG